MKRFALFAVMAAINTPLFADVDAGFAAVRDLGSVNGQALACSQMAVSSEAKALMIKHAPKSRRYGEVFETSTSEAFLAQGKPQDSCPAAADFATRLDALGKRLQSTLPAAQ